MEGATLRYNVKDLAEAGIASVPKNFVQSESTQEAFIPHNYEDSEGGIPVIDLSGLQEGPVRRGATLAAIASACQEWGFFQVVNSGISPSLVEQTFQLTRSFFDLPSAEKEALAKDPTNPVGNGYGRQFLLSANATEDWQDIFFHYLLPPALKQIDSWPRKPADYRATMEQYGAEVLQLTERLLDVFAELLGLPKGHLQAIFGETMLNVRLIFYAACPEPSRVLGSRAHSDPNVLTVLLQDHVGGLQVKKKEGHGWVNVTPVPGALVINLGDQMQTAMRKNLDSDGSRMVNSDMPAMFHCISGQWEIFAKIVSNGKFQSVEHRVVTNQDLSRLSLAMFRHPSGDANIGPASSLLDELHPTLYPTTNYATYRASFHQKGQNGKVLPTSSKV